jgi:taurine dioxygenase
MKITPIGETIGAEVTGIDMRQPLDAAAEAELKQALLKHIALVIRDQELDPNELARAVKAFGEPMKGQYASEYAIDDEAMVTEVSNQHKDKDGNQVYHGRIWHSDQTHRKNPPNYTVLYGVKVAEGGDTGILNTRDGYESLPEEMKARLDKMVMHNLVTSGRARLANSSKNFILDAAEIARQGRSHPLVREHPETGTKAIYLHAIKIDHIDDMSPEDTRALIEDILGRIDNPTYVYRHKWRVNDLLIWDNRSALHMAYSDYDYSQPRLLYRTILRGTTPYGPAMPKEQVAAAE